jgi:hypothetical protein
MLYARHPSTTSTHSAIMTASRRYVDLLEPRPEVVELSDLAAGLDVPRFKNQTQVPVTIADHSLRTARFALAMGEPVEVVLACLLHEVAEPYLGDMPGPLKRWASITMPDGSTIPWSELEQRWTVAICRALLPERLAEKIAGLIGAPEGPAHDYDAMALRAEALLWMPGAEDWAADSRPVPALGSCLLPAMLAPKASSRWDVAVMRVVIVSQRIARIDGSAICTEEARAELASVLREHLLGLR